jgi:hypothetical protein
MYQEFRGVDDSFWIGQRWLEHNYRWFVHTSTGCHQADQWHDEIAVGPTVPLKNTNNTLENSIS